MLVPFLNVGLIVPGVPGWLEGVGLVFGALLVLFIAFFKLYRRTEADVAFVRTGVRGLKVVVDGGCLVIPGLHEIKPISLSTMQLGVERKGKDALITQDRYRCDVVGEFYIKVDPKFIEHIQKASRSLGDRSMSAKSVQQLVEAKLVGALRSVAATMDLTDLHMKRDEFADKVKESLHDDLLENGLTLESVSVTNLDQTDKSALDPDNVFDAEGLRRITDATERARAEKNQIQRSREAEIAQQDRVARELVLEELAKTKFAEAEQRKNVETFGKQRESDTERFVIEQDEAVEKRRITKERSVQEAELDKERELIQKRQEVEEREIQKTLAVESAEIDKERDLIARRQEMETAEEKKQLAVAQTQKDKEIGIIQKVREQEVAEAEKLSAVAGREKAAQNVLTVQATEQARREKEVTVIHQQAESEKDKISMQIAADAAAYEAQIRAEGDLKAAELRAQAIERMALAKLKDAEAVAEGSRKQFEAKNLVSKDVLLQEAVMSLIQRTPEIVREAMKPAERIEGIKVLHVSGLNGGNGADGQSLTSGIVGSFLRAGAALPMLKEFLKFAGVDENTSLADVARKAMRAVPQVAEVVDSVPEVVRPHAKPKKEA